MKDGKTITFLNLFSEVEQVQIPIIQRDYAQGRTEAFEVRRQFLSSIKRTLSLEPPELKQPLDLDFVYGSFEEDDQRVFSVLDGQQRLTTLFILHWYLANKDNSAQVFQSSFVDIKKSRFTYKTRTSAAEFFNALAICDDIDIQDNTLKLSEKIINQRWFFLSWKSDPTVQSCLRMLDEIDKTFYCSPMGLYGRITASDKPYIVFQFLNLQSFGLSDELYIKMNARGKPLTDFENFKAWLCSQIGQLEIGESFEAKLDQNWTDIFWCLSRDSKNEFDDLYLRFFNLMAFYRACEVSERSFDLLDDTSKFWIRKLRIAKGYISTDELERNQSFDTISLLRIERVLDYFAANINNSKILKQLEKFLTDTDNVSQIKFYAMCLFIESDSPYGKWSPDTQDAYRWDRVTNNLINNQRIDELASYISAIKALGNLSKNVNSLYEFLAKEGMDSGFSSAQREEENLKAELILDNPAWDDVLRTYEGHSYLKGKVGFLLDLAIDDNDVYSIDLFEQVAQKCSVLLSDKILLSNDFVLQRALLSLDNYLLNKGTNKYSFCLPYRQTYRQRAENWLRVVTKPVFAKLLNKMTENVEECLQQIIGDVSCGGWRQLLVENPHTISYCKGEDSARNKGRMVHISGNALYLLSKLKFSAYHSELRTYILHRVMTERDQKGLLSATITGFSYNEVYGNEHPNLSVKLADGMQISLAFNDEGFFAFSGTNDEGHLILAEIPGELDLLIDELFPQDII